MEQDKIKSESVSQENESTWGDGIISFISRLAAIPIFIIFFQHLIEISKEERNCSAP